MAANKRKFFLELMALVLVFSFVFSIGYSLAAEGDVVFTNPLSSSSETTLLNNILKKLEAVVVTLAIIMIVIGGIMYMASFGNDTAMKKAKTIITAALVGLAIVLGARTFLQEIWNILGVSSSDVGSPGGSSFLTIATSTLNLLLSLVGAIGIIGMVVGGIMYLTSYGDDDRIKLGKKMLTASIIGIVICLSAVVVIRQIMNLMG